MAVLTEQQRVSFWRDGYLRYGRVFSEEETERLRNAFERAREEELRREDRSGLPPEFAYGHDHAGETARGRRAIHQFVNLWKVAPEFAEVVRNPVIAGAAAELIDCQRVRLWHDQAISKPPGDNDVFRFHHDFYFWPLDRPSMVSCWLALDNATPENGCMHVIPGSHRDPRYQPPACDLSESLHLLPVSQGPGEPGSLYEEVRQWREDRAVPVPLLAGECMFHHCLNYHMTPRNVTDRQRRAFVSIYMPDGTRYKHSQSPNHPCTNMLGLKEGALLGEPDFPVCWPATDR